jgi:hypothetical protein
LMYRIHRLLQILLRVKISILFQSFYQPLHSPFRGAEKAKLSPRFFVG